MANTTAIRNAGKHSVPPPTANKLAGTPGKRGVAVPPSTRQDLGTGTKTAWKSKLPVPIRKTSGGGTASKGTASLGATAPSSGLSSLPVPPPRTIPGRGASKLPIPTRKAPGGASGLPVPSPKTPKNATETPRKVPLASRQAPRTAVASSKRNRVSEHVTKAKSPTPAKINRTINDTTRKLAGCQLRTPKVPSVTLPRSPLPPAKVNSTAGAAAATQRQNGPQPPPCPVPITPIITPVTTPTAPVAISVTSVVDPRVFVPLPSTCHEVKVCEGECFKPLPTELQQAAGALYLQRHRPKSVPEPGCPQLQAKLVIAAGSEYKQKPPPGASPIKHCLLEEEVVTRDVIIRVNGKVVAPHLGPKGRPNIWKGPDEVPIAVRMHFHRKLLMEKRWSPWGPYLRELADGEQ